MIEGLWFIAGAFVSWSISRYYYVVQRREDAPKAQMLAEIHRKVLKGWLTKSQAAQEIMKALDVDALDADDLQGWEWMHKFCPECKGAVEIVGSWSADEHNAFGGTIKCTMCPWKKVFSG